MHDLVEFFIQAIIIAIAGAFFVAILATFFDAVLPRISRKPKDRHTSKRMEQLFEDNDQFDVLLSSGQTFKKIRFEKVVQLSAEEYPSREFVMMRDQSENKVLIRLDGIRIMNVTSTY